MWAGPEPIAGCGSQKPRPSEQHSDGLGESYPSSRGCQTCFSSVSSLSSKACTSSKLSAMSSADISFS